MMAEMRCYSRGLKATDRTTQRTRSRNIKNPDKETKRRFPSSINAADKRIHLAVFRIKYSLRIAALYKRDYKSKVMTSCQFIRSTRMRSEHF